MADTADRSNETLNIYDKDSKLVVKGDKGTKQAAITGLKHGQKVADGDYLATFQDVTSQAESDKAPVPGFTVASVAPNAPALTATAGDGKIDYAITASTDDGGSAITKYVLSYAPAGGNVTSVDVDPAKLNGTLNGLTNGTEYTLTAVAVNAVGEGLPSGEAKATPVAAKPAQPANAAATANGAGANVSAS